MHAGVRRLNSVGAKRPSSAIPKLNLAQVSQAPKKVSRKNTNLIGKQKLTKDEHGQGPLRSSRGLVIPRVVKAIRNIDTTPGTTNRSNARESARSQSQETSRSTVTVQRRIVPLDIFTDSKAVLGETILSDRSTRQKQSDRRVNRHS